jgi:replicative DNA helicase
MSGSSVPNSKQIERHVLSGLLKYPQIYSDVATFLSEKDFFKELHQTIFLVVVEAILNNEKIDKVLIANKIKNLGVSFEDDVSIFDYIENLIFQQITEEAAIESCRELAKLRVCREMFLTFEDGKDFIKNNLNNNVDEIIAGCDKLYGDKVSSYTLGDEPRNLFEGVNDLVEEMGLDPNEEAGYATPYPEFNRHFGGLMPKNIYSIISRPGEGKSTWINDMCFKTALKNNVKALILDTEMSTQETQFRMMAAVSGVPLWYLQTGNWRKNEEMVEKVRKAQPLIEKYTKSGFYSHYHVGSYTIEEVCSAIRRWYYSKVGRGNPCILAYDYIKLTGERVGNNWAEYQAIGEKVNQLKRIAEEIDAPIITAMQQNRSGENTNRRANALVDDASTAAQSDRLNWIASFLAIFRRKTPDEIANDTLDFGTHKLIPLKTRFQGREAAGHQDLMRRTIEEEVHGRTVSSTVWTRNFLNYNVDNFEVQEKGSLRHLIEREQERYEIRDENNDDGDIL